MSASEYRHIVRIAGKDVDGSKNVVIALSEIRGIGFNLAYALLNALGFDPNARVGFLSEKQVSDIEDGIRDPLKLGLPQWFLNRRKDIETGSDMHIIASDWDIMVRNDIEREKQVMSWRGFRHMFGLKVRGQRTRTTGRKGGAVGVKKAGKITPTAAAPGAAPAPGETAPAAGAAETTPGKTTPAKTTPPPPAAAAETRETKPTKESKPSG
ncbi:MAG: 30S ribosomal protein S13 [Nitrososphaerales archaeon]